MDRDAAQARLDRVRAFYAELAALEQEGLVAVDASRRPSVTAHHERLIADLTNRFDLDQDDEQRRMSIGMRIASVIGAVALSAAIVLLFYRIWGNLTTAVQAAVLMAAPLVSLLLVEAAHRFDRSRHLLFVAAVIACAAFVMNVMLLGDIFAMASSPNALGAWAVFALALGYIYGLRLPIAAGLGLAIVFIAGTVMVWFGFDWKEVPERPEVLLLPAVAVFTLGMVIDSRGWRFPWIYRVAGLAVAFGSLWALSMSANLSVLPGTATQVRAGYQVCGFAAAAAAIAVGVRRSWDFETNLSGLAFVVFLYTKFFQWWWDWMPAYLFFFIVGVVAVGLIVLLQRVRRSLTMVAAR